MITRIRAENFKSWKDTGDIRLAPLTGLFGTNNSGKTSIIQTLLLMKQTTESKDREEVLRIGDEHSMIHLGTFSDVIHDHQLDAELGLSFSWELLEPLVLNERLGFRETNIRKLSFNTVIREYSGSLVVLSFAYEFDIYSLGMSKTGDLGDPNRYGFRSSGYSHGDSIRSLSSPIRCYGFPNNVEQNWYSEFLLDFAPAFEKMFSQMYYLSSLHECPQQRYSWAGEHPHDIGIQGEQALATLLATRVEEGRAGIQKEERIAKGLRNMGLSDSFDSRRIANDRDDYEIRVKTSKANPEVSIINVGSGVAQILPMLILCYYAPENSIILLEQPEIHLHPSAQAELADVLIDVVKDKERNIQIILESHSEHLLRRIQRRIAEEELSPDMVALYFCRMEDGESKIEELDVDEYGNITNWPQNFFGDEMGELAAMTEAAMKRKIESGS